MKPYIVKKGALLFKSESDSEPTKIGEKTFKVNLGEADYDPDALIDPEVLDFFEADQDEMWDEDYVEKEVTMNGSTEATIDAATVLGDATAVAKQNFFSVYESNAIIDLDDEISFMFEADLPYDKLVDGAWIAQFVSLTPTAGGDSITVGCFVQVGNPYGMKSAFWQGSGDMSFSATGTSKLSEINASEMVSDSGIFVLDDPDFYALADSESSFKNKIQSCQAKLPIEKQGADSSIFTTYNAKLQLRIYANKDDTAPLNLNESEFEVELKQPTYET